MGVVTCTRVEDDAGDDDEIVADGETVRRNFWDGKPAEFDAERADALARDAHDAMKASIDYRSRPSRNLPRAPKPQDLEWLTMEGGKRNYKPGLAPIGSRVTTALVSGSEYVRGDAAPANLDALADEATKAYLERNEALRNAWRTNRGNP